MNRVLIIGASSAIAQAAARLFAESGAELCLAARSEDKLAVTAEDLKIRGAHAVHTKVLDVLDFDQHQAVIDWSVDSLSQIDTVLIAHGTLPDQAACEQSWDAARRELEVNALSTMSLLTLLANYFEERSKGSLIVISSVAGDRGRQSNYVYGAAKGAVSIFMQGLRNRLHKAGVSVTTIKPGFVDTPMTADFDKGLLWAQPEAIAKTIFKAAKGHSGDVYAPFFWRPIMGVIRAVPEFLFKRLSL